MTFGDSVLHLVRAGARIDRWGGPARADEARPDAQEMEGLAIELAEEASRAHNEYQPGLADLEAAVGLVSAGLASRVVLSGFPSWPGLLWQAYQLAEITDLLILPTVVRPGGKVDIVITRDIAPHG